MLLTILALSAVLNAAPVLCDPKPLPPKEERTKEFWLEYLNETLHLCFDDMSPVVEGIVVRIVKGSTIELKCEFANCVIKAGDKLLDAIDDAVEIVFLLAHEAAHMYLRASELYVLDKTTEQFAADKLASDHVLKGSCYGARIYEWMAKQKLPGDIEITVPELIYRRYALLASCALEIVPRIPTQSQ